MNHTLPKHLIFYIGRRYLFHFFVTSLVILTVLAVFDVIEIFRRASGKAEVTAWLVVVMSAYKLPLLYQQILPLIILFSSLLCFFKFSKYSELVVARSAGVSVWQILMAPMMISLVLGGLFIMVFNPLATSLYQQFEQLEARLLQLKKSTIDISKTGIWLRDHNQNNRLVINAQNFDVSNNQLQEVVVFIFDKQDGFWASMEGERLEWKNNQWVMPDGRLNMPGQMTQTIKDYKIGSAMNYQSLEKNFASEESMSFWDLPAYISLLSKAGVSPSQYLLKFHSLLATPVMLIAMTLTAAVFGLKSTRTQKIYIVFVKGLAIGFLLFLGMQILNAIGLSGYMPVSVAGWLPALLALSGAFSLLIHYEDG